MSDDKFDKFETKFDKLVDDMSEVRTDIGIMKVDVANHIKRTNMLEELYMEIQEKRIPPLEAHVNGINGVIKFIGLSASVVAALLGVLKLFGKL